MPPYAVEVRYNVGVPVRDGLVLSANLWLPVPQAAGETFPVILEMIPYRKDDWRFSADHARMGYFAERGFAGCRLDIRGTGSSPGVALDEYTRAETEDGYDAVQWLAAQPWCSGSVGMWGISYGGFTSIQVAMLQPPALKAIAPMYATDDRYTDDVHYLGGCLTASEWAQYAVSQIAMNAMPPKLDYAGPRWAERWRERLEQTPPWLIAWIRRQTDGPYWRQGSLAPDYGAIRCPIFHIGGWADGYTNPVLRMQQRCAAPRRAIIGPWVHSTPEQAYPGPNIDYLHELTRFFGHWLRGDQNGVMDEPALTIFRQEYTPPEAFPAQVNGAWHSEAGYPIPRARELRLHLGGAALAARPPAEAGQISFRHQPAHGTRAGLCYGAGSAPNGLARDLRPDEALIPTFTGDPLAEPLDLIGFPEARLAVNCSAPVANLVVRLTDVAPDGTSAHVSVGVLNLTHRDSHSDPAPLEPGNIYDVRVPLKAVGYRFLPGHRVRLSVAGGYFPVVWPAPHPCTITLHTGGDHASYLALPEVPPAATPAPPAFKATPPELRYVGGGSETPAVWEIREDVLRQRVTVVVSGGDLTTLPGEISLATSEHLEITAHADDPAHASLRNAVEYELTEQGYRIQISSGGTVRSSADAFHIDLRLSVRLNGSPFFERSWVESIERRLV